MLGSFMFYESIFYARGHKQEGACRASNATFPATWVSAKALLPIITYEETAQRRIV
jgi:hypothetical protein